MTIFKLYEIMGVPSELWMQTWEDGSVCVFANAAWSKNEALLIAHGRAMRGERVGEPIRFIRAPEESARDAQEAEDEELDHVQRDAMRIEGHLRVLFFNPHHDAKQFSRGEIIDIIANHDDTDLRRLWEEVVAYI